LEQDPTLAGKLRFRTKELLFRINDRLAAPSTDETFSALRPELEGLASRLFAGPSEIGRTGDAKSLFSVRLAGAAELPLGTLLANLGGPPGPDRSLGA
jgi:hypothetical protein